MKNAHTDECLKTLIATIRRRMEIYSSAIGFLKINSEASLRGIFRSYKDECAAAIRQLTEDLGQDNAAWCPTSVEGATVLPIGDVDNETTLDLCAMLNLCRHTEELCTQAYRKAIGSLDETRVLLSFHVREQAEEQYMAFNHIKTLLDCNLLNRQAV